MDKLNSINIRTYKQLGRDYLVSDIVLHIDKILIRLDNGSIIHLPLGTLNKEEIQSLKNKHISASTKGNYIVFSEPPQ